MARYTMVVLVKQVPDTKNITGEAMKEDGTVNRAVLPAIFNPEDLNALEMALQIKEQYGGEVHVISMGPPSAVTVLREALYRGADYAHLLSDRKFAGSDTLATSFALKQAVKTKIPDFKIKVRKLTENGSEIVETDLPALLTVTDTANEPRPFIVKKLLKYRKAACEFDLPTLLVKYPHFKDVNSLRDHLKSKDLYIEMWGLEDIDADPSQVGFAGSPTMVKKIESITLTGKGFKKVEPNEEGIKEFVAELIEDHTW
jgi:electron transfer flavoprotein beta subunit